MNEERVTFHQSVAKLSPLELASVFAQIYIDGLIAGCNAVGATIPAGLEPDGTFHRLYTDVYFKKLIAYLPVVKEGEK